jgi:2'-5' RNA ligase
LDGKPRPLSQFHITVLYFGPYVELGEDGIEWAERACATAAARTAAFQAHLNQIKSFPGRPGRAAPLVLVNDQQHPGFDACYRAAFDDAKAVGLVEGKPGRYTPRKISQKNVRMRHRRSSLS